MLAIRIGYHDCLSEPDVWLPTTALYKTFLLALTSAKVFYALFVSRPAERSRRSSKLGRRRRHQWVDNGRKYVGAQSNHPPSPFVLSMTPTGTGFAHQPHRDRIAKL